MDRKDDLFDNIVVESFVHLRDIEWKKSNEMYRIKINNRIGCSDENSIDKYFSLQRDYFTNIF
jgi:hypothetical protein